MGGVYAGKQGRVRTTHAIWKDRAEQHSTVALLVLEVVGRVGMDGGGACPCLLGVSTLSICMLACQCAGMGESPTADNCTQHIGSHLDQQFVNPGSKRFETGPGRSDKGVSSCAADG